MLLTEVRRQTLRMTSRLWAVVFDANDPAALARFWADALEWDCAEDDDVWCVTRGDGTLPRLEFAYAPNEKQAENWMHFDLSSTSDEDRRATEQRLLGLGAVHHEVGQEPGPQNIVLADPEGNAFCILEPENTFVDAESRLGALSCAGTPKVGYFWRDVLGWPLLFDHDDETAIRSPEGGVFYTFGYPVHPKVRKNRLHVDIAPPADGDQAAEVDRLLSLGAARVDIGQGDVSWVVLADPDGNEFCVLTPRSP